MSEIVKRIIGKYVRNAVLKQKNEWPVASIPVFYQPERPEQEDLGKEYTTDILACKRAGQE